MDERRKKEKKEKELTVTHEANHIENKLRIGAIRDALMNHGSWVIILSVCSQNVKPERNEMRSGVQS